VTHKVHIFFILFLLIFNVSLSANQSEHKKRLVYIVSDLSIPFWEIMNRGVLNKSKELGYQLEVFSSDNSPKKELQFTIKAIRDKVDGIVVSPTGSSACTTILKFAQEANIPVVISDIGTDSGKYVSFVSSDNFDGAYQIGKVLRKEMLKRGWENKKVGIVAIPQKRLNGQLRTSGFMQALREINIQGAGLEQQVSFSMEETYRLSRKLIEKNPDLGALWLQGSDKYEAALQAIEDTQKEGKILLLTFDAEPEFLELIKEEKLLASAMQQPYLMGEEAVIAMDKHLNGKKVEQNIQLNVLPVSKENIDKEIHTIKRNVLGIE